MTCGGQNWAALTTGIFWASGTRKPAGLAAGKNLMSAIIEMLNHADTHGREMDDDAGWPTERKETEDWRLHRIPEIDFHPGTNDGKVWSGFTRNVEIFFDGCYVVRRPLRENEIYDLAKRRPPPPPSPCLSARVAIQ